MVVVVVVMVAVKDDYANDGDDDDKIMKATCYISMLMPQALDVCRYQHDGPTLRT